MILDLGIYQNLSRRIGQWVYLIRGPLELYTLLVLKSKTSKEMLLYKQNEKFGAHMQGGLRTLEMTLSHFRETTSTN